MSEQELQEYRERISEIEDTEDKAATGSLLMAPEKPKIPEEKPKEIPQTSEKTSPEEITSQETEAVRELNRELKGYPYTIIKKIGGGGMGDVYLAQEWKTIAGEKDEVRPVAVKFVKEGFLKDGRVRKRFDRELRELVEAGRNPYVVKTFDVIETEQGKGIVMEYMEEGDLKKLLDVSGGRMDEARVCAIARQTAIALQELHKKGLVHRDLKPGNIFVNTNPFFVKLGDFGVVGALAAAAEGMSDVDIAESQSEEAQKTTVVALTKKGMVIGSPQYVSPEAARGEPADHRSDLYSLGATLYELLTGTPPFGGFRLKGTEYFRIKNDILPKSVETVLGKGEPTVLDRIVMNLLKKKPEEREKLALPDGTVISLATAADVAKAVTWYAESKGYKLASVGVEPPFVRPSSGKRPRYAEERMKRKTSGSENPDGEEDVKEQIAA